MRLQDHFLKHVYIERRATNMRLELEIEIKTSLSLGSISLSRAGGKGEKVCQIWV